MPLAAPGNSSAHVFLGRLIHADTFCVQEGGSSRALTMTAQRLCDSIGWKLTVVFSDIDVYQWNRQSYIAALPSRCGGGDGVA
jgi:hypothetical protein